MGHKVKESDFTTTAPGECPESLIRRTKALQSTPGVAANSRHWHRYGCDLCLADADCITFIVQRTNDAGHEQSAGLRESKRKNS